MEVRLEPAWGLPGGRLMKRTRGTAAAEDDKCKDGCTVAVVPVPSASENTRARLLAAARGVFEQEGLHGARMGDVAKAADVSRQALYYHFHSKRELAAALVRSTLAELGEEVRDGLADGPVEAMVPLLLHFYVRSSDLARLLLLQQIDLGLDLAELRRVGLDIIVDPLAARLERDVEAGGAACINSRTAALAIVGAINGCAVDLMFQDGEGDVDQVADELAGYVRRMIAAPGAAPEPEINR